MVTAKEIGKIFQEARKQQGLSPDDAAKKSRIHLNVINDIENGIFDRLGKPYVKGFLKKYSVFLEIDTENIMRKYEAVSANTPGLEFSLNLDPREKETVFFAGVPNEKKLQYIVIGGLSIVLIVLVFVLAGAMRSKISSSQNRSELKKEREVAVSSVARETRRAAKTSTRERVVSKTNTIDETTGAPINLKLKARGEVWVQVKSGNDMLFAGILNDGDSKSWNANGTLSVWTGNGGVLDFYINTRRIGTVAAGVVKNIKVSSRGVKIGNVWVAQLN